MRFLVDANLSPRVAARLRLEGHDVEHVGDAGLLTAEDGPILAHAASTDRVILSADSDFATLLAVTGRSEPSSRPSCVIYHVESRHLLRVLRVVDSRQRRRPWW